MNDEKMMNNLRTIVGIINAILMIITVVLQIFAFNAMRHVILCDCILLLTTVELVFDGILKDSKGIAIHGCWQAVWLFNLILNLFRI
jgi:hypothetical protein